MIAEGRLIDVEQLVGLDLLENAVDLHVHCYPELDLNMRAAAPDDAVCHIARAYGMAGLVFKSVAFPTAHSSHYLAQRYAPLAVLGSITLNAPVGGISALAVEIAARQGARVVWFPHWSAANDRAKGGFSRHTMFPAYPRAEALPSVDVTDDQGALLPSVNEVLEVARDYGMLVASGHLSPDETMKVFAAAHAMGCERMVFTHPLHGQIGGTEDHLSRAVELGASVEISFLGSMPMHWRISPDMIAATIRKVGPEHVVVTSDAWREYNPVGPELLRIAALTLRAKGFVDQEIHTMISSNPRRLVGM